MDEYNDQHRTFLQAIMQAGIMLEQDAQELSVQIFNNRFKLSSIAEVINCQLHPLNMIVKSATCEITGDVYWTLANTILDESIVQMEFAPNQLSLLRSVYAEIISSENGSISSMECLNLCSSLDSKLSKQDGDEFLKEMVNRKWLCSKEGYFYMGVRSIAELMPYFKTTRQDFNNCPMCRQVVFYGKKCDHCQCIMHCYCFAKFMSIQNEARCFKCKQSIDASDILENFMNRTDEPDETVDEVEESTKKKNTSKRKRH